MEYLIKRGTLYQRRRDGTFSDALAKIQNTLDGQKKEIVALTDLKEYAADVCGGQGVNGHRYELCGPDGRLVALGLPCYAADEDPASHGWPVSHLPKADHAHLRLGPDAYELRQLDQQHYRLYGPDGAPALSIAHRGLPGGWDLVAATDFPPPLLCALLVFCLYLDRENEFLLV